MLFEWERYCMELSLYSPEEGYIPQCLYWGERRSRLRAPCVCSFGTPVHSVLHEACQYIFISAGEAGWLDRIGGRRSRGVGGVCFLARFLLRRRCRGGAGRVGVLIWILGV